MAQPLCAEDHHLAGKGDSWNFWIQIRAWISFSEPSWGSELCDISLTLLLAERGRRNHVNACFVSGEAIADVRWLNVKLAAPFRWLVCLLQSVLLHCSSPCICFESLSEILAARERKGDRRHEFFTFLVWSILEQQNNTSADIKCMKIFLARKEMYKDETTRKTRPPLLCQFDCISFLWLYNSAF